MKKTEDIKILVTGGGVLVVLSLFLLSILNFPAEYFILEKIQTFKMAQFYM